VSAGGLEGVDGIGDLGAREARAAALLGRVVRVVGGGRVGLDGELCVRLVVSKLRAGEGGTEDSRKQQGMVGGDNASEVCQSLVTATRCLSLSARWITHAAPGWTLWKWWC
jgi:hypothetical protein